MIQIENLTKRFGNNLAVDGLSLSVGEGEVLGLLGPNGAGKTTTVRMLACLIAPTSGRASIGGLQVGRDDDRIRQIVGILTESPGLYEKLSARQNLDYFARLYGLEDDERDRQVEKYLHMLGLWERRREPVSGFSKGMKQKLAIARALVHEPVWPLAIIVLVPLLAVMAVSLGVMISSRVNDTRVGQQIGALIVLPLVGLAIAQAAGKLLFSLPMLFAGAAVLAALDAAVLVAAVRLFQRETILTRWK